MAGEQPVSGQSGTGEEHRSLTSKQRGDKSTKWGQWIVGGISLFLLIAVVIATIWGQPAIAPLRDQAFARGLITFLICLATIGLAFILVFQAFFGETGDDGFRRAREVFAALTGILGTIVGFYFGTADSEIRGPSVEGPRFAVLADGRLNVTGHVVGGKSPYQYRVVVSPATAGEPTSEGLSTDGWIERSVKTADKLTVTIHVIDSQGRSAEKTGDYQPTDKTEPAQPKPANTPATKMPPEKAG